MSGKFELGPVQKSWIKSLRSGQYQQGRRRLIGTNGVGERCYCCLGVACMVAGESGVELILEVEGHRDCVTVNGNDCILPTPVLNLMRFRTDNGGFDKFPDGPKLRDRGALASANDVGASFDEIADFVETYPELVFDGPA